MCGRLHFAPPVWTHRAESRTKIQHRRIYAFAADRYADAKTESACKFWKGVMDRCVKTRVEYIPLTADEQRRIMGGWI